MGLTVGMVGGEGLLVVSVDPRSKTLKMAVRVGGGVKQEGTSCFQSQKS